VPIAAKRRREAPIEERTFSTGRSAYLSFILLLFFVVLVEGGARLAAFVRNGWNPAYLIYGIRTVFIEGGSGGHDAAHAGYFKYPPNRVLHQYGKVSTAVRINNIGFRGPDFDTRAGPRRFRVVAMGESSTFGYYSPDEQTYPYLLEQMLEQRVPVDGVDVLNAGIPHMTTDNMLAMLRSEILGYGPRVITLYSGYNDAATVMAATLTQTADRWAHGHLASYIGLKWVLSKLVGSMAGIAGTWGERDWAKHVATGDAEYIGSQIRLHEEHYGANVREFVETARGGGAEVIFIRQHMTTSFQSPEYSFGYSDGPPPPGLPYAAEVDWMAAQLARNGRLSAYEAILLIHSAQLAVMDRVAAELGVEVVDNVSIVDAHPEYHASFVHLTPDGNRAVAGALSDALAPYLSLHAER
jgi:lysophospholipase L1-like esterase